MPNWLLTALAGIVTVVTLFFGIQAVQGYFEDAHLQDTVVDVQYMMQKMRPLYQFQTARYGTTTIAVATLMAAGVYHPSMPTSSTTVQNPSGGQWITTGNTNSVYFDLDNLTQAGCINLLSRIPQGTGVLGAAAATTVAGLAGKTISTYPITPDTAASSCTSGSTNAVRLQVN